MKDRAEAEVVACQPSIPWIQTAGSRCWCMPSMPAGALGEGAALALAVGLVVGLLAAMVANFAAAEADKPAQVRELAACHILQGQRRDCTG